MINGGPDLGIERAFADIGDDADDLRQRFRRQGGVSYLLADGVFAGEVLAGQRFVDDDDVRLRFVFAVGEVAAAQKLCADGAEVGGADVALVHFVVLAVVRLSGNSDPGRIAVEVGGQS